LPQTQIIPSATALCFYAKAPPPLRQNPLYITNCVYRI
jgi:hypothetical protein